MKPLDPSRFHRVSERRRPAVPEALAHVCNAWAGMERAIQAEDLGTAAAALWLVMRRLEEAWLSVLDDADERPAALLYIDVAHRMADWLDGRPGVEAHRIAESRATCLRLQLASLQAIGNA